MAFHLFMAESSGIGGLFQALGLNWQSFLLDLAAFLVTAYVVGKYVFPPLTKALDAKRDELEAATRLQDEAGAKLDSAKNEAAAVIKEARVAADEISATAKADAAEQLEAARQRAQEQGDRLVAEAREQLSRDVLAARKQLKGETAALVAEATEAVLGEKLNRENDGKLISRSLEEAK
jgi:F-type H+-transporting ATPase subunit b